MKKWIRCTVFALVSVLFLTLFTCTALPSRAVEAEDPEATEETTVPIVRDENGLTATQAFVSDRNGNFTFRKGVGSGKVCPASITKLFSAFVALQYLDPDTQITAGSELELVAEDSSRAFIYEGQTVTVSMLVEGMLLPSGNDASYILATAVGRKLARNPDLEPEKAVARFVDEMNATARALGLNGTQFMNPDGYHLGSHYTSLEDLAKIAKLVLENPVISRYASTAKDDVTYRSGETNSWKNTNALLHPDSEFYRSSACGLKTGFTDQAGNCLLSAFRRNDGYLIIGVFGCPDGPYRFEDTLILADRYS